MNNEHLDPSFKSINSLNRLYPRERLFVRPPFWTSRHLHLLDCHFKDINESDEVDETRLLTPSPSSTGLSDDNECQRNDTERTHARAWGEIPSAAEQLATRSNLNTKQYTLTDLLEYPGSAFEKSGENLVFRFAGRRVYRLNCLIFSSRREPSDDAYELPQPRLAYLDYADITIRRRKELEPRSHHPHGGGNASGAGLFRKQLSRVTPIEWSQDPFLVSVLISIAQAQQRYLISQSASRGNDSSPLTVESVTYMPLVLMTHRLDRNVIHLYKAGIPSMFLKKLDQPDYDPKLTARVTITHRRIPFKPYETFKERVAAVLSHSQTIKYFEPLGIQGHSAIECGPRTHDKSVTLPGALTHSIKRKRVIENDERCGTRQKREQCPEDARPDLDP